MFCLFIWTLHKISRKSRTQRLLVSQHLFFAVDNFTRKYLCLRRNLTANRNTQRQTNHNCQVVDDAATTAALTPLARCGSCLMTMPSAQRQLFSRKQPNVWWQEIIGYFDKLFRAEACHKFRSQQNGFINRLPFAGVIWNIFQIEITHTIQINGTPFNLCQQNQWWTRLVAEKTNKTTHLLRWLVCRFNTKIALHLVQQQRFKISHSFWYKSNDPARKRLFYWAHRAMFFVTTTWYVIQFDKIW